MADESIPKSGRKLREATTIREQAERSQQKKSPKVSKGRGWKKPFIAIGNGVKKVFRPFRFMSRPLRFIAKIVGIRYVVRSFRELRQVTWPDRRQTWRLTWAVILFSLVFGVLVFVVDYGLDKAFKEIFVK